MTLTIYILIAIPICILTILIWAYFDYQKYKREHHLIILLSFLFPTLSHAQYVDNEKCCISFKTYENHQGILEYIKENVTYQFIPSNNAWKVTVKNNTNETIWLNWEKANFIINGRASGVSFYPSTIVLTGPHAELSTKKKLEQQGYITYVPLVPVRRSWAGYIKEIHIPAITRCVFVYATNQEIQGMQKEYTILPPQTITALHQNQ